MSSLQHEPIPIAYGIDFGGTGIKGAAVTLGTGEFHTARTRVKTPSPSTPASVAEVIAEMAGTWEHGPVGIAVPAVVRNGLVGSAANIDPGWIGTHADALFTARLGGRPVHVVNDADAAGLAEVRFGAAQGHSGLVVVTTLGTGIGSAMIYNGVLQPNTELGHLEIGGHDAETRASNRAREDEGLSWSQWAARLTTYYRTLERLFSPDLFVIGGGISKQFSEFGHLIEVETEIVPATMRNRAGIVGAALLAAERELA